MGVLKSYIKGDHTKLNELKYGETPLDGRGPIVKDKIPTTIDASGPSSNQLSKRVDDVQRIGTILTRNQGLKFIGNNAALNQITSDNKISKAAGKGKLFSKENLSALKSSLVDQAKDSAQLIASTIAQVPVNGTGTHFVHKFTTDTYLKENSNASAFKEFFGAGGFRGSEKTIQGQNVYSGNAEGSLVQSQFTKEGPVETLTGKQTDYDVADGVGAATPSLIRNQIPEKTKARTRIGTGDPGLIDYNINSPIDTPRSPISADLINEQPIVNSKVTDPDTEQSGFTAKTGRDLIKFRFKIITPDGSKWLYFRAFLDSFNDSYNGNWSSFNYVGRGEQFHTYNSFDRKIDLGFKIAAQTRYEMRPLYQKMVYLASSTAPTYSEKGFMRGTLAEVTVGSYIYQMPGIINSVTYNWQQDYQWEIAMNAPETVLNEQDSGDIYQQELPMVLDCNISFTPIHKFTPQTGLQHYITADSTPSDKTLFFKNGRAIREPERPLILPTK